MFKSFWCRGNIIFQRIQNHIAPPKKISKITRTLGSPWWSIFFSDALLLHRTNSTKCWAWLALQGVLLPDPDQNRLFSSRKPRGTFVSVHYLGFWNPNSIRSLSLFHRQGSRHTGSDLNEVVLAERQFRLIRFVVPRKIMLKFHACRESLYAQFAAAFSNRSAQHTIRSWKLSHRWVFVEKHGVVHQSQDVKKCFKKTCHISGTTAWVCNPNQKQHKKKQSGPHKSPKSKGGQGSPLKLQKLCALRFTQRPDILRLWEVWGIQSMTCGVSDLDFSRSQMDFIFKKMYRITPKKNVIIVFVRCSKK